MNIEIQPGKYYRTRSGRKAFVNARTTNPFNGDACVTGWVQGYSGMFCWRLNGRLSVNVESPNDLIEPWTEPAPVADPPQKTGVELIAVERDRQVFSEHWDSFHDDEHDWDQLAKAAACYAMPGDSRGHQKGVPSLWPWERKWWKPTPHDRVRELVKAGALIAAEIDRLQRAKTDSVAEPAPDPWDYQPQPGEDVWAKNNSPGSTPIAVPAISAMLLVTLCKCDYRFAKAEPPEVSQ